jgi:predicted nucleotidyltransferase
MFATNQGTIAPDMSTAEKIDKLGATLFGKTRRAVLALLYSHPDESFYLRQIARVTGAGMGSLQRELKLLSEAGIIQRSEIGRQAFFQANSASPVFSELRNLIIKTFGVADVVRAALSPLADTIKAAFIFGSMTGSEFKQDSDVDVMVIGDTAFSEVVAALSPVQETLAREINPSVYPAEEFRSKLDGGHHFLKTVMKGPKLFLIGDENELKKLAG